MKKLIFSIVSILVTLCASAQVNLVKVADYFDDFEITNFNTYYDTIYNNGNDVTMSVNVRFKLKKPFGTTNLIPNGSRIAIYYEPVNGNNIRTTINDIILDGQWQPPIGGIYSPYRQVNVTIPKEYLLSGNLRTYFMSPQDPVANYWGYGISVAAKSSRKLTVINVPNFIGPSQLCSEATYTIERPGTITLENATGIASLTALGNNKWKVTKIGSNSGTIQLVSSSSGKKYSKSIVVGTLPPRISGPQNVTSNNSYTYTVYKSDPNSTLSIGAYAGPGMPYTLNVVGNQITLNTNNIAGNVKDYFIQLKATETNSCGTSNQTVFSVRFRGGDGPIN